MFRCPSHEQLWNYLEGTLPQADSESLENHAETCGDCRKILAELTEPAGLIGLMHLRIRTDTLLLSPGLSRLRIHPPPHLGGTSRRDSLNERLGPFFPIPGYEVLRELGRGGRGVVYLAREQQLRRLVAIKMILQGGQASTEDLARFRVEAQAMAALRHPHLVVVHSVAECGGVPYYVMEYVEGGSLRQHLMDRRLSHLEAARLMLRLADALAAVHAAGFIHRDLKPDNVLLTASGEPKVSDFGLVWQTGSGEERITQTGTVLGTPLYMAPEQAAGRGDNIGPTADVYSLGAIFYELLTGVPPIQGSGMMALITELLLREAVNPRQLMPSIPRDLETICLKCLHKETTRRYPTAQALAEDLGRFLAGQPIQARPTTLLEHAIKWARRNPGITSLLAVILVLITLSFALVTGQWLRADQEWGRAEANARAEARAHEQTSWTLYGSRLVNAIHMWHDNDMRSTRLLLDDCPERFHHWEYGYLRRLLMRYQHKWDTGLRKVAHDGLTISPDGLHIAAASSQGELLVFAANTRKPVWKRHFKTKGHASICFSPDSKRGAILIVAEKGNEGHLSIWDAVDGQDLWSIPVKPAMGMVRFSPDGRYLVYGGGGMVHVLGSEDGKERFTLPGPTGMKLSVAWSPDGRLVVGAADRSIIIWEASTGKMVRQFANGHCQLVTDLAISPDSQYLATGSLDSTMRIWHLPTGEMRYQLQGHAQEVLNLDFSPDSKRLVSCGADRTVRLWDLATGQLLRTLRGHETWVVGVSFFPDGQRVLSNDQDGMMIEWDSSQDQENRCLYKATGPVQSASLSPDGSRLVAIADGTLFGMDTKKGKLHWSVPLPKARSVQYSNDGRWVLVCSEGQPLQRWDATTGQLINTLEGNPSGVTACVMDRESSLLACIETDQALAIRDALTGRLLIKGKPLPIDFRSGPLCFSSDSHRVFLGSSQGRLQVWDTKTGDLRKTLSGHPVAIHCLATSANGRYLASGSADRTVKVWDADTGIELNTLRGHPMNVLAVTFTPDSERLVSGCYFRRLKVWSSANGQELLPLDGHLAAIWSLAFNANGRWLLSSSEDGTIRLWDGGGQ